MASRNEGFSAEERAAMKARARELKLAEDAAAAAAAQREAIAALPPADRALAERIDEIVREAAPSLSPKTWYGMPAYSGADGKAVVFFQPASKFKARYATLGFNEQARLDEGAMWPTSFAILRLDAEAEERIAALVRRAAP
ncbi:MAG: DUF1801 domain-containing protein [Microbacteriaceae bacterium]